MKAGLTTSLALHAVVLGFGLVTLSSPRSLEMTDVESFPIDIVPVEEFSQSVMGERTAPVNEAPAPKPTTREEIVPNAQNVGDNTVDLPTPPTPEPRPRPVETAEAPPPAPEPAPPAPEPKPEPERQPEPPQPVPATEVIPEPAPKQEVTPDPVPEKAVAEAAPQAEAVVLPDSAPVPSRRPQPAQAQTAKAPERRDSEKPSTAQKSSASSDSSTKSVEDQVAALLNRERPSGGGAQRSNNQASLGGRQTTGSRLTQSEMDALRGQIQRCWNVPAGAADAQNLKVSVQFKLDRSGALEGDPRIVSGGGGSGIERAAADSARRAVIRCAPYTLPSEKFDAWADVIVHFDPRDMF